MLFGSLGVTLFFVLSGFLITYLLISEKENTSTVQIKKFYIRRVLRIWPLYYLIVVLGLFVFPFIPFFNLPVWSSDIFLGYGAKIILFMLILPNVSLIIYPAMPFMKQTWSIGVEEQFYLLWPVIIKYSKNYLKPLLFIAIFFLFATGILFWITNKPFMIGNYLLPTLNFLKQYFLSFRVGCMAIGGIAAYIVYFKKESVLKIICSSTCQYFLYAILVLFLYKGISVKYIQNEFYSCIFAAIIVNLACNKKTVLSLSHKLFEFLGKISYGIYMYHPLCILVVYKAALYIFGNVTSVLSNIFLYSLTILFTIVIAFLSFKYIESYFLKFKDRFTIV